MKTPLHTLLALCLAPICLLALGCGRVETDTIIDTPPPSAVAAVDHDHKHGPNGLPVVETDDGAEIEWDFDEDAGSFTVIPPAEIAGDVETVQIKTVTEGTEKMYPMSLDEAQGGWTLVDKELGTAMMMGDAVERTLIITSTDGKAWTAAVAHIEGH